MCEIFTWKTPKLYIGNQSETSMYDAIKRKENYTFVQDYESIIHKTIAKYIQQNSLQQTTKQCQRQHIQTMCTSQLKRNIPQNTCCYCLYPREREHTPLGNLITRHNYPMPNTPLIGYFSCSEKIVFPYCHLWFDMCYLFFWYGIVCSFKHSQSAMKHNFNLNIYLKCFHTLSPQFTPQ